LIKTTFNKECVQCCWHSAVVQLNSPMILSAHVIRSLGKPHFGMCLFIGPQCIVTALCLCSRNIVPQLTSLEEFPITVTSIHTHS